MTLMISVSGIRGIVGETMTPELAEQWGAAFATHCGAGRVVVGRDSRPSGRAILDGVVRGLTGQGCDVADLGIVSTPGAGLMVRRLKAVGGVVVTASHNPKQWNGIKFLTAEGGAPAKPRAEHIIDIFQRRAFSPITSVQGRVHEDRSTHEAHVGAVLELVNPSAIAERRFKVVLDSVNGAGGAAGRMLLERLGCEVIHLNPEPTGEFAHAPEPVRENLLSLIEGVQATPDASVGFAQDPDADRLAIVDDQGRYIGEEYTLAIAAKHVFAVRPGPAAANLSTSRMIDVLAARAGGPCVVHRSAVGEANVVSVMREHGCVIGGEGNGGVIEPKVVPVRDSLVAMAYTLQLMADADAPLSGIVDEMPRFEMVKRKFPCSPDQIRKALTDVRSLFADCRITDSDGLRIDWPEGWVHIRGSNTEPIIRIIAEADDREMATELIQRVSWTVE